MTVAEVSSAPRFLQGPAARFLAMLVVGLAAWSVGLLVDPSRAAFAWLAAFASGAVVLVGLLLFVALQDLTGAVWAVVPRHLAGRLAAGAPVLGLLLIPVLALGSELYPGMGGAHVHGGKAVWLSLPLVALRAALYLAAWTWMARSIAKGGDRERARRRAGLFVVLIVVTASLAAMDWLMALDPHWYSTIFGPAVLAQGFVGALALLCWLVVAFERTSAKGFVRARHRHDLAKWLFAMAVFWAYLTFSQWFLVWYANIPEETAWMLARWRDGYDVLAVAMSVLLFGVPFLLLMTARAKRDRRILAGVAPLMLAGHYLCTYWLVMPARGPVSGGGLWIDAGALLAVIGALGMPAARAVRRDGVVPEGDPRLAKALLPDEEEDELDELEGVAA